MKDLSRPATDHLTPLVEPLWTVRHGERSVAAGLLRNQGQWEVRLFSQGCWFASERAGSREMAMLFAQAIQKDLAADGWVKTSGSD